MPPPSQGTLAIDLGTSTTLVGWQGSPGAPLELLRLPPLSATGSDAAAAAAPLIPSLVLPTALQIGRAHV